MAMMMQKKDIFRLKEEKKRKVKKYISERRGGGESGFICWGPGVPRSCHSCFT